MQKSLLFPLIVWGSRNFKIISSISAIEILRKLFKLLDTRFSIASRIEFQVETVNLHLHGTVGSGTLLGVPWMPYPSPNPRVTQGKFVIGVGVVLCYWFLSVHFKICMFLITGRIIAINVQWIWKNGDRSQSKNKWTTGGSYCVCMWWKLFIEISDIFTLVINVFAMSWVTNYSLILL